MGNLFNRCRWGVLVVVLLAVFVGPVQAETKPATPIPANTQIEPSWSLGTHTLESYCNTKQSYFAGNPACEEMVLNEAQVQCGYVYFGECTKGTYYKIPTCPANSHYDNTTHKCHTDTATYQCEQTNGGGWALSGQTCTRPDCEAGKERNAQGVCVKDCTGKLGQSPPSPSYEFTNDGGSPSVGGCLVTCNTWTRSGGGSTLIPDLMVASGCTYTGASDASDNQTDGVGFTPKPEEPKTPKDCTGAGMGYISGSTGTTCVAAEKAPEGQKPASVDEGKSKESGSPGSDGKPDPNAQDYKKEDSESKTEGGKTTTKKTETIKSTPGVDGGESTCPSGYTKSTDGAHCTKVTVTKQDTPDFCKENPQAAACKNQKDSSFSGTCEAGFGCEGDAAQCAAAKASWELKCSMEKGDGTSDAGKGLIDGIDPLEGMLPNQVAAETFNFSNLVYVDTSGTCPPDLHLALPLGTVTLSMQEACTWGTWLGRIGVALTLLLGSYIIIGGIRN